LWGRGKKDSNLQDGEQKSSTAAAAAAAAAAW